MGALEISISSQLKRCFGQRDIRKYPGPTAGLAIQSEVAAELFNALDCCQTCPMNVEHLKSLYLYLVLIIGLWI